MSESDNIIDAPELARLMRKSHATIWRWAHNGQIPPAAVVMFGRVARFRRDVLVAAGFLTPAPAPQPEAVCDVG
jgi:predicted DNA-binding transcriptional regulator AlpA